MEVLDSGRTPEEVCAECPELLPVLRRRLRHIRRVERGLQMLFPSSAAEHAGRQLREGALPHIPTDKPALIRPASRFKRFVVWALRPQAMLAFSVLLVVLLGAIVGACLWFRQLDKAQQNKKLRHEKKERQTVMASERGEWTTSKLAPYNTSL